MDVKRVVKGSKEFNEAYSSCLEWGKHYKFPIPPIDMLPDNAIVSYNDGKPVSSGFIYKTDSKIAILEWVIADPKVSREIKDQGINMVLSGVKITANLLGFDVIFTSAKHERLIGRYKEQGFDVTDEGMTHFIGRV